MANKKPDKQIPVSAGQAMNIVLKAEQDAEHSIAECKQMAHQTIQNAQQKTAKIARHTNKRLTMLHLRSKQNVAQCITEMEHASANELQKAYATGLDKDKLTDAVHEVAAKLIGLPDTGKSG